MDFIVPRYTNKDVVGTDRLANLDKLLTSIKKRKAKTNKHADVDSGIECNATEPEPTHNHVPSEVDVCSSTNVTVIGGYSHDKSKKTVVTLPKWLAQPNIITTDLSNLKVKVRHFKILDKYLLKHLRDNGIKYLFPVQSEVIPWLLQKQNSMIRHLSPRDVCVSAPTGSGKTLAYVLPILHTLKNRLVPKIRAMVVVPVQELALQVAEVFRKYAKGTKLRIEVTTGGKTEFSKEQIKLVRIFKGVKEEYESKVDILITTPGRLVEHLKYTKGIDMSDLKYLVIDEADRVMENIQDNWMHILMRHINITNASLITSVETIKTRRQPQKLLFSATLSHDPGKLKQLGLFQPILFTSVSDSGSELNTISTDYVGKYTTPKELDEFYVSVSIKLKPMIIWALINRGWTRVLCFAKTIDEAHRLCQLLKGFLSFKTVSELSSKLTRKERDDTLKQFGNGEIDILVCSDVMARGVDIPSVQYVVSYDPPKHIEGYIHRIGRTGRAGIPGTSVILLDPERQRDVFLQKLNKVHKFDVQEMLIPGDEYLVVMDKYKSALGSLKGHVEEEKRVQNKKRKKKKPSKNKPHKKVKINT